MRHVDRQYLQELHTAIDLMTATAEDEIGTNAQIAKEAKIGVQTLINLRNHKTRLPQHYTLLKLARATGFQLNSFAV